MTAGRHEVCTSPTPPRRASRSARARFAAAAIAAVACSAIAPREAAALDPSRAPHQYVSRVWSVDQGLPQNTVQRIAQTADGYMWFGTEEGLARFDGERFVVLDGRTAPALHDNEILGACVDGHGTLWATGGGLVHTSRQGLVRVDAIGFSARSIACGADDVWVRVEDGVFRVGATDGVIHRVALGGVDPRAVRAMRLAPDGTLWAATDGEGLLAIRDDAVVRRWRTSDGIPAERVTDVSIGHDGAPWVAGKGGVAHLAGGRFVRYGAEVGLPSSEATAVLEDAQGSVWIACADAPLFRLRDGRAVPFTAAQGLADEPAALFEDRDGALWLGTLGAGAQLLSNPRVVSIAQNDGLAFAWSVYADTRGDVWVGTRGAGLHRLRADGTHVVYAKKDGLPHDTVFGISEAHDGSMWVATEGGGAAHLIGDRFHVLTTKDGLAEDNVRTVYEDSHGDVWFGFAHRGLQRLHDGELVSFTDKDALASNLVRVILETHDGDLLVGTNGGGLTRFHDGHATTIRAEDGLGDDGVSSLSEDPDGTVWIGTFHGVTRLAHGRYTWLTTRHGLSNDVVFSVLSGPDDTLWMSSNVGVSSFSKRDFDAWARGERASVPVRAFGRPDGMKNAECNGGAPAAAATQDGKLWFANVLGVVQIDPAHLPPQPAPPRVLVEEAAADHQPLRVADPLVLAAGTRDLEVRYTAPAFVAPEKLVFRYRLDGFDRGWVDAGGRRVAYYTNVPPGEYVFHVAAANDGARWGEEARPIRVRFAPYYWQTAWFRALAAAALALFALGAYLLRVRGLKRRARELEDRVRARTTELNETLRALEDKDRVIGEDLEQARAFQQRMLPAAARLGRLRLGVAYRPAGRVGGDVYDVTRLDDGTHRIFLADTTGHGIQASLRTMVLYTEYEAVKRVHGGPAAALDALNRKLCARWPDLEMRCSAVCLDVREDGRGGAVVRYANAAQPPLLHASGGAVDEVYERGAFLGVDADVEFGERALALRAGDRLLAYTDGIFEQEDAQGVPFGSEPIVRAFDDLAADADRLVGGLVGALTAFAGRDELDDDVTLLCVECPREAAPIAPVASIAAPAP